MHDIMKPQAAYSHDAVKEILVDVTQSSVMRLDSLSMGKLWDLITMVFKWQLTMTHDIVKLTLRHLYEIETYVTGHHTTEQLHKVQDHIDSFNKLLTSEEKITLREDLLYWLKPYNIRVSLLLRMGLQNLSGNFISNNLDPLAQEMLKNLGENIFAVTKNGTVMDREQTPDGKRRHSSREQPVVNELQVFVDEIGAKKRSSSMECTQAAFKLAIDENSGGSSDKKHKLSSFNSIEVEVDSGRLSGLMNEMNLRDEDQDLKDQLLDMIGGKS